MELGRLLPHPQSPSADTRTTATSAFFEEEVELLIIISTPLASSLARSVRIPATLRASPRRPALRWFGPCSNLAAVETSLISGAGYKATIDETNIMLPTREESLKIRRFGLIVANCLIPGLGNTIFVSPKRFGITIGWLIFQIVLQNPFPYFAFVIGSIAYGLIEINNSPLALSVKQKEEEAIMQDLPANTYVGKGPEVDYATDGLKRKQEMAAKALEKEWQAEEQLDKSKCSTDGQSFDPRVPLGSTRGEADSGPSPSDRSWLTEQLQKALAPENPLPSTHSPHTSAAGAPTDPGTATLPVVSSAQQDPRVQQITDPAVPLSTPSSKSNDPWQPQQTDPGAPQAVPFHLQEVDASLQQITDPVVISGLGEIDLLSAKPAAPASTGVQGAAEEERRCHSCGYKRDHDYAFCPQCATMF
jgi:hypothetical protein